jgi:hypothetical protein
MNYLKVYTQLIESAKSKNRSKKTGYYESHHIVPKCMGGSDDSHNLVLLTPREHFIAHLLLYKDNPIRKLRDSVLFFKGKDSQYYNSRLYESVRIDHIIEMKTNNPSLYLSKESKQSKSAKLKTYVKTEEHKKNISKSKKGKQTRLGAVLTEESKYAISESVKKWHAEVGVSDETREKLRLANTGRTHSSSSIELMTQSAINRKRYICPICNKENLDGGNFNQHMIRKHDWKVDQCNAFKTA